MKEEIKTITPPPRFRNPFPGCMRKNPNAMRINAVIPMELFNRVKQCRLESGTVQTTINLLWLKLVSALDKKGITSYADVLEFEQFLMRSVLVEPGDANGISTGSTVAVPDATTSRPNDGRGATSVRGKGPHEQDVRPDVKSDAGETSRKRSRPTKTERREHS